MTIFSTVHEKWDVVIKQGGLLEGMDYCGDGRAQNRLYVQWKKRFDIQQTCHEWPYWKIEDPHLNYLACIASLVKGHHTRHTPSTVRITAQLMTVSCRKNAGILLRRMSDDFNVRKFPELLEGVQIRPRSQSEGSSLSNDKKAPPSAKMYKFIRRLSSSAISPTGSAGINPRKPPTLPELPNEEDKS